ncbi:SLIT2 [Branchiostoma lanceolatum]|uniref:SLIT2 protein n=1 Tax=Branchiostoma lanceolatum TaxID=7740 RepID=A0A8J9YZM9_BRALA|nr:SLIT2 [Branchiostoma lanceolatum]
MIHQYEVISDDQADLDIIIPYGQAAAVGVYGMDSAITNSATEVCVTCDTVVEEHVGDVIPRCPLVEKATTLWLRNFRFGYLSSTNVSHLKHLRNLYIEPGNLMLLDNKTFEGFQSLYNLSLSRNNLPYLGKKWLVGVIGHLNLAHNKIAHIEDEAFGVSDHCLYTLVLLLSWNKLERTNPGYFRHLCNLMVLDLSSNRIHTIDKGSFDGLYRLRVLRLGSNNLTAVLRGATLTNEIKNPNNSRMGNQQTIDQFSQHTYETVEDQPHQYETIRDEQNEDNVITPYGQATLSGAYGLDSDKTATTSKRT